MESKICRIACWLKAVSELDEEGGIYQLSDLADTRTERMTRGLDLVA